VGAVNGGRTIQFAVTDPRQRVVRGDVTNAADVRKTFAGADAALSALGSREMSRPTTIYCASAAAGDRRHARHLKRAG